MILTIAVCATSLALGLLAEPASAMPAWIWCDGKKLRLPDWWLAQPAPSFARYVTWRCAEWWHISAWRFALGPAFRNAIRHGVWTCAEGDLYVNGRLQHWRNWH